MSTIPVFGFVSTVEDVPQFRDLTALMRLLTTDEVGQGYSYAVPADAPGTAAQDGLYTYDSTGIQATDGYDYTVNEVGAGKGYFDFTYDVIDGDGNHVETRKIIIEIRSGTGSDEELSSSAPGYSDIPSDSADTLLGFRGDDTLDGGGGDDILIGGQGRDHLIGGDGDDYLFGSNGWDILEGGAGKDTIIGWGGNDTVVFDGNLDEFTVEPLDDGSYRITRKSDTTDSDTVSEVEFYQFNDGTLTVSELSLVLPDQSSDEDTEVSFTLPLDDYTDYFGDTLSLKATLAGGAPLPSWLSFDRATGTFSGTPPQDFNGSLSIEVQANGDTSDPVTHIFELTITPVNDDPEVGTALADQSFDEDTAVSVTIPSDAFTDVDGDTLELTAWQRQEWGGQFPLIAYSPLPLWLSFDADTGIISGTPPQDFNGSLVIAIRASDGNGGDYAEQLFTLTIDPVNDNPEAGIALMDVIAVEGTDLSFDLPDDAFTDADGDALTYSATLEDGSALPSWLIFDPGTGTFSGTPPSGFTGTLSVKVTASDGKSGSTPASQVFNLTVEEAEYVTTGYDPVGGETEVVSGFNAEGVSVGALADGGYVVVWSELIASGGARLGGLYSQHAQRYDSDGTPIGSAFTVGTNVRSLGVRSEVVSLEDGGFLIQKTTVNFRGHISTSAQRYD
ncbi:MAG: putative Ig domain-containing protein, partial [Pseudomonadota bacterium]